MSNQFAVFSVLSVTLDLRMVHQARLALSKSGWNSPRSAKSGSMISFESAMLRVLTIVLASVAVGSDDSNGNLLPVGSTSTAAFSADLMCQRRVWQVSGPTAELVRL